MADKALDPRWWAVVVVNWNRPEDTIDCLASLRDAAPAPGQVVLVDNASTDGSADRILAWAADNAIPCHVVDQAQLDCATVSTGAWLTLVRAERNAGFSIGNNVALRPLRDCTRVPYVLLLNNDAAVAPDFFAELRRGLEPYPDAGLATGTIYEWDRRTVWYSGGRFNPVRALVVHDTSASGGGAPRETEFVCGCAMLIRRDVLEEVGLLPECYQPFYGEDADYSLRARAAGWRAIHVPTAAVYHRVGSVLGRTERTPLVTYCLNRHRAFVLRRNYTGWRRLAGLLYLATTKPGRAALELLKGRPATAWGVLAGTAAGIFSRAAHKT